MTTVEGNALASNSCFMEKKTERQTGVESLDLGLEMLDIGQLLL